MEVEPVQADKQHSAPKLPSYPSIAVIPRLRFSWGDPVFSSEAIECIHLLRLLQQSKYLAWIFESRVLDRRCSSNAMNVRTFLYAKSVSWNDVRRTVTNGRMDTTSVRIWSIVAVESLSIARSSHLSKAGLRMRNCGWWKGCRSSVLATGSIGWAWLRFKRNQSLRRQ